ncbi:Plant disease resistance response protein [Cynara cardunculus var. scolymus]|uniref:Dirigent protein n=3 Tax=Cynara cardunculus var. scolymus TaxID=59895 RepID=A0A118JU72_CYNCS|nr:Plant disease resistance response protein [Cynara cardunculus var. scolymus]
MATSVSKNVTIVFAIFLVSFLVTAESHRFSRNLSQRSLGLKKEKLSHFRFYFHDIVSGPTPTAIRIVEATRTNRTAATGFGDISMIDNPLTIGPERTSRLVGRAQGMYTSASLNEMGLLMAMNFVFVEGKYNGSTLSILGRNPVMSTVREMPVVGGSGLFRFSRGYVLASTYSFNMSNGDAVVEFNAYVLHYYHSLLTPMAKSVFKKTVLIFTVFLISFLVNVESQKFSRNLSQRSLGLRKEKLSHFRFYFHDIVSGPNATAIRIVEATRTNRTAATGFGDITMIDNPLTIGPERTSRLVGRAQGMYTSASLNEMGLLMVMNYVFVEGKYNGSTLSIMGRNPVMSTVREMPVVGGSGLFRFSRGYAQARTHTFNMSNGDAVVEFNVYVLHY